MRYLLLTLILTGCTTSVNRTVDGCESVQGLCIYCYNKCGTTNLNYKKEGKLNEKINVNRGTNDATNTKR